MNQSRRDKLHSALDLLQRAETTIEQVCDDEKDSLDNTPENLQYSDRYVAMEEAVNFLEDAIYNVQEAAKSVDGAINSR